MSETRGEHLNPERAEIEHQVETKEARKLKAQVEKNQSIWFGIGMMGLVGWSVAIPALIGATVGVWIDSTWETPYSFALMLLIFGIFMGCLNAWNWVERERTRKPISSSKHLDRNKTKGTKDGI